MIRPSRRILITRLSHIGDAILTMPLAVQLKRAWPDCHLTWAAEAPTVQLLRLHPAIDRVVEVPKGWAQRPSCWWQLRAELRAVPADISFDPQSLLKSALLARLSGARQRIGFAGKHGREGSPWINNCLCLPARSHLVDRTLELLRVVGLQPSPAEFGLPVCPLARDSVQRWLSTWGLARFVLLNPGAGWRSKQWPSERFAVFARRLLEDYGVPSLVVWAGATEQVLAREVVAASEGSAQLAPPTSLAELAALAAQATLFVGGDTGPIHLAAAMGCPCIGLYGPTRPAESGAYGSNHRHVQKWYQAGSNRQRRSAVNLALQAISVEDVLKAIPRELGPAGERRSAG